jgi:hypothetical protein
VVVEPDREKRQRWGRLRVDGRGRTSRRTRVPKRAGSKSAALAVAYKLLATASNAGGGSTGHHLIADVLDGVRFKAGIRLTDDNNHDDRTTDERVAA